MWTGQQGQQQEMEVGFPGEGVRKWIGGENTIEIADGGDTPSMKGLCHRKLCHVLFKFMEWLTVI